MYIFTYTHIHDYDMDICSTIVTDVLRAYNAFCDFNRHKMSRQANYKNDLSSSNALTL